MLVREGDSSLADSKILAEGAAVKTYCILLASGSGTRFGGDIPKQFVKINGRMVIEYTLDVCVRTACIDEIIVVVSSAWLETMRETAATFSIRKPVRVVPGGKSRMESCFNGVTSITDGEAKVMIHNAVQPFITSKTFEDCCNALDSYDAVTVGSPSVYTVLELDGNRLLRKIVDRNSSVNDLGPECFKLSLLRRVMESGGDDGRTFTNITGLVFAGKTGSVYVVDGDPANTKITYAADLIDAERRLAARSSGV